MTFNNKRANELYDQLVKDDKDFIPDKWQSRVLEHEGNIAIRAGRQVGKSVTVSKKASKLAIRHPNTTLLMIAAAQRQSSEIFQKTLSQLYKLHEALIKDAGGWKDDPKLSSRVNADNRRKFEYEHGLFEMLPTRTETRLKNGTRILSLPTGKTGAFIRCYTVDFLIPDEAAYIAEPVWVAIMPMLAVSKKTKGFGWEICLSTPFGKGGHFYNCCHDPDYLQIHIRSTECSRISKSFLIKERNRLSKLEYAQEYLGEFIDEYNQFFPTALIKERMTFMQWDFKDKYTRSRRYYLGVDIARYGADENAFVIAELSETNKLTIIHAETTNRKSTVDTVGRILIMDDKFHFRRVFLDDGGVGAGVTDMLIEKIGRRAVGINNSSRSVDADKRQKSIMKEDLYSNALVLMESSKIDIINNMKLQRSLKSMTFEYNSEKKLRIYGKYSHLCEAFVRACWCMKQKGLKLFIA